MDETGVRVTHVRVSQSRLKSDGDFCHTGGIRCRTGFGKKRGGRETLLTLQWYRYFKRGRMGVSEFVRKDTSRDDIVVVRYY